MVFLFDLSCIVVRFVIAAAVIPMAVDEWKWLFEKRK